MILIIDNYGSFTYNLYQMVGEIVNNPLNNFSKTNSKIMVIKNNEKNPFQIQDLHKKEEINHIIISPGPGNPENKRDFGECKAIIKKFGPEIPIMGVCLGHQGIFSTFGGKIIHQEPVHGKQTQINHNNQGIFQGLKNYLLVARYHSLSCDPETIPECLEITAKTDEGIIMALKHNIHPIYGLQFHPESIGTPEGMKLIENFLKVES